MPTPPACEQAPTQFVVPRLEFPFEAPPDRRDADTLRENTIAWGERYGLIGRRGRDRLSRSDLLGLGVALAGPAPLPGAAVLMDWFLWALVLDDRVDDGPWAEGGTLDRFTTEVARVIDGEADHETRDPMVAVLARDLWPRTRALGDAAWLRRVRGHLMRHLAAQGALVHMREAGTQVTVGEYQQNRRDAFGALLFFDLMEAADGAVAPADPCGLGCSQTLRSLAADIIAWTNDIHSIAKDTVHGERFNLVAVLADSDRVAPQDALERAADMVAAAVDDFRAGARRHLDHRYVGPAQWTTRLAGAIRASGDWHRSVSRYHLQPETGGRRNHGPVDTSLTPPTLKARAFEVDPYPLYERLRETMPIAYDEPTDTWLLSRYEDVRVALTDPRFSNDNYNWQIGPMLGRTIVSMDGREHAAHRALLTPEFRGRAMAALQNAITDVTRNLVVRLRGRRRADLVAEFTSALPVQVMAGALGLPADTPEQVARLKRWCRIGFSYMGNYRQDPSLLTHGLTNRDDFFAYVQPHIEARRADPRDDLISAMLDSRVDGEPLPEEYIRGCCAILMTAGSETSHGGLANLIVNVLDVPGLFDAVRADPAVVDAALTETLRRDPPLQLVLRQTHEQVDLPSGRVPAGATVACLIGSANRDPRRFPDPDAFDLQRASGRLDREYGGAADQIAFGAGRHFCLGSHLARAELTTGLRLLIAEYPDLRWAPGFTPTAYGFPNRWPNRLEVLL